MSFLDDIRKGARLAVEAARVELERWKNPGAATAEALVTIEASTEPPHDPKRPTLSKWCSTEFHTQALAATTCPDCDGPKKTGWYRCDACHAVAKGASRAVV